MGLKLKFTEAEKRKLFSRNKNVVNRFVRGFLAKNKVGVVHGGRAQNNQLPRHLQRKTKDWDVFVKNPEFRARQLEQFLDKKFGGDFFRVKKGKTKELRVNKIMTNTTNENIVDFSKPDRKVPSIPIRGVQFAKLEDQVARAKQNLKKKSTQFRRGKDLDFLKRVKKFEKIRGKKI